MGLRVTPSGITRTDANNCRAFARRLVLAGRGQGHLPADPSARGGLPVIYLVQRDSLLERDAWPRRRVLVAAPPFGLPTLGARLQALVLEAFTGQPASVPTANRVARSYRDWEQRIAG